MDDKLLYKMQKDIEDLKASTSRPHERLVRIEKALDCLLEWHRDYEYGLTDKAVTPLIEALEAVADGAREGSGVVRAGSGAGASGFVQSPASKRDT